MNAVKHFLGNYSDNFAAALVLWPALSFLLTLPILAYLYHRDGRLRFGTFVGAYLTAAASAASRCTRCPKETRVSASPMASPPTSIR